MIVKETGIEKPSFLQKVAPRQVQKAVIAVKDDVKDLALKSSAVDVALGVLVGAAITPLVTSLVNDLIVPPVAMLIGKGELDTLHWVLKDGPTPGDYKTIEEAKKDGAVIIRYGAFAQSVINGIIILIITYGLIRFRKASRQEGGIKQYVKGTAVGKLIRRVSGPATPKDSKNTVSSSS